MKFDTWIRWRVIIHELLRLNWWVIFYGRITSIALYETHLEINFRNTIKKRVLSFENLPYSEEEIRESFREEYLVCHPLTQRKIKRNLYIINIHTKNKELEIETTKKEVIDMMKRQYEELRFMEKKVIHYKQYELDCNGTYYGYTDMKERIWFDNLIEYKNHEYVYVIER